MNTEEREKKSVGKVLKTRMSAKRLAFMAIFVALSYAVSFWEIPLFPATPYLKLDFGNVFILLVSFLLGPIEGVIVCALKESLRMLSSSSGCVGEVANMAATTAFILLPSIIYQFRKGLRWVIPCLIAACFIGTGAALITNRFITFPLYMKGAAATVFADAFWFIVAFNLIKTASISLLTVLLYKRLSNFLKKLKI
ncbi:MAG: ECF transporter S component [Clostridia bacterium]|nr:ECF transporter S component [Clostridia bacterium]